MKPISINATLPPESFALVLTGEKRFIRHKRNPRIDRYFLSKIPTIANIRCNGETLPCQITRIEQTPERWIIHIKRGAYRGPSRVSG
ncbi:MAG TPA: hypothetical protein PKH81_06785 [Treponemataceae bacterium]|nr:hypothetical protein [Treponemataceae bacterium]